MKRRYYFWGLIFLLALGLYLLALSWDVYRLQRKNPLEGTYVVYVFSYGWHTGLVLNGRQIPGPFKKYFALWPKRHWLEISWGDNRYYRNREPAKNWYLALRAFAWPTHSVLHIMGFSMPLNHLYRSGSLQKIYLSRQNYLSLLRFVSSFFVGDSSRPYVVLGRGLYGDSYFLKSNGTYVFPSTCNVWTARALKAAGFPLNPLLYQLSGVLMRVLREVGKDHPAVDKNVRYARFNSFEAENGEALEILRP